jgi:prepilin-type N-terminal cleavage/methylation domain-containing protein
MMVSKMPKHSNNAFTLVELLVALVVTSIVLTAVATLGFALGTANDSADDTRLKQAQVRYATVRISELIRHCKLICSGSSGDFAIWRADENGDGQININELVYIVRGLGRDRLMLCEFPSSDDSAIDLGSIEALSTNWWSAYSSEVSSTRLIPECGNVEFSSDAWPPLTRFVSISFDVLENGVVRQYQISAGLRGWSGNILNQAGDSFVGDDD